MTMRTTTRTSSARSWLATTSSTLRTGTTSRRRVRRCPASGQSEGLVRGTRSQPPPWTLLLPQPIHHLQTERQGPRPSLSLALSPAKDLVTRLMEVEQDQRITAEEAISHEW